MKKKKKKQKQKQKQKTKHFNISDILPPIVLILGHTNKSVNAHFRHGQFGQGSQVQKVILTKNANSPSDYMVWSWSHA